MSATHRVVDALSVHAVGETLLVLSGERPARVLRKAGLAAAMGVACDGVGVCEPGLVEALTARGMLEPTGGRGPTAGRAGPMRAVPADAAEKLVRAAHHAEAFALEHASRSWGAAVTLPAPPDGLVLPRAGADWADDPRSLVDPLVGPVLSLAVHRPIRGEGAPVLAVARYGCPAEPLSEAALRAVAASGASAVAADERLAVVKAVAEAVERFSAMAPPPRDASRKVPAVRLADGAAVALPVEDAAIVFDARARSPGSNGLAAGPTLERAIESALLELIERDAVAQWWHGARPPRLAKLPEGAEALAARGWQVRAFALETEIKVAVRAVEASHPDHGVALGFGAGGDAGRHALGEVWQSVVRRPAAVDRPVPNLAAPRPADEALPEPVAGEAPEPETLPLDELVKRVSAAGFSAVAADLTHPAIGVPVARVVVPGLALPGSGVGAERAGGARRFSVPFFL